MTTNPVAERTRPDVAPTVVRGPGPAAPESAPRDDYSAVLVQLHQLAALPADDPRRPGLRQEIVLALMPVVRNLAARHSAGYPAAREELAQVGAVGLITAVDRWDPERSTGDVLGYIIFCVRGEIFRYFRDRTWSTRVSRRLKDLSVAIKRAVDPLAQTLGRTPRPSELAAHLGADTAEVIEALEALDSRSADSLDGATADGSPLESRMGELDEQLDHVEYQHALRPLLNELPERERTILLLRFFGEQTQTQIAAQLGISQMHVSRLLSRTLAQLRAALLDDTPPEPAGG